MIWWWYKMWVVSADLLVWWIFDLTAPPTLSLHGNIKRVPTQLFFLLLETISDHLFNDVHWLLLTVSCFCPQVNQNTFSILTDTQHWVSSLKLKEVNTNIFNIQYSVYPYAQHWIILQLLWRQLQVFLWQKKHICLQYNILNAKLVRILPSNIFFSHF